jgi:gluconate 2-dehydrogenase gamma chain
MGEPTYPRRDFLAHLASAAGVTAFAAELQTIAAYAASAPTQAPWEFFTAEEAVDFEAVAAQIVPTDETPGAREARVVRFADRALATIFPESQTQFRADLKQLADFVELRGTRTRAFATLHPDRQLALLAEFQRSHTPVFGRFRQMTMRGMFSHPVHGGNFQKIGWRLIGFDDPGSWSPPFGYYDRV